MDCYGCLLGTGLLEPSHFASKNEVVMAEVEGGDVGLDDNGLDRVGDATIERRAR